MTANDFSPRIVSVLIDTIDWSPTLTLRLTVNVTLAVSPTNSTPLTWPTLIPDTLTSFPGEMPPASLKYASYCLPCGQNGNFEYPNETSTTATTTNMPMMPVRRGLRSSPIVGTPAFRGVRRTAEGQKDVAVRRRHAGRERQAHRRPVDLQSGRAVEDVEVRAIRTKGVKPQIVFGEWLDDPVDLVLAVVHLGCEGPDVLDHALNGTSRILQHISQIRRGGGQRRKRACDGVSPLREPRHQLLELVDAGVELRALLVDGGEHGVQVVDDVGNDLIPIRQILAERPGAGQQVGQRAALALQQLDDRIADLVDLVAVQSL